ncbi:hypothetical protein N7G274_001362 [Stereocaulon virgatum]|uniref:SMP-30/Gluconolactonase/LRE-like region domain-containing protein n=1 Tax=Stereocaulon virgatum TaxID=373712 RepID=A0ABR4ARC9_9LECA
MRFSYVSTFGLLPLLLPITKALFPTNLVYEFPNGTWVENLAVRPCGSILLTIATSPDLYLIDPLSPSPEPVHLHHFDSASGLLGITETSPDTFHLIAANFTSTAVTPGSNHIFTVALETGSDTSHISLAATLPEALLLNGLTTLNPTTILAADSPKGVVWAINVVTGDSRIVLNDTLMAPTPALPTIGINGLKVDGSTLYFTNSAQALFAKIEINADGTAAGKAVVVARSPRGASFDDFALYRHKYAFLATGPGNSIYEVAEHGMPQAVVAGNVNSTEIAEPTSAQFGRTPVDNHVLYVTTAGRLSVPINGYEVVGGQLVAVDTRR